MIAMIAQRSDLQFALTRRYNAGLKIFSGITIGGGGVGMCGRPLGAVRLNQPPLVAGMVQFLR